MAEDDVAADPSAAEMSESRVSVRLNEEMLVEGLELGGKLSQNRPPFFQLHPRPHVIECDVSYAGYKTAKEAGCYSRVA